MKSAEIKLLTHFEDFFFQQYVPVIYKRSEYDFSEYETNIIS